MNRFLLGLGSASALLFTTPAFLPAAIIDYNGDGYDDVWQQVYTVTLNEFPIDADNDGDGATNGVEAVAGTDPRNPKDCIKVGNTVIAGSNIVLSVQTEKGKSYQLQTSTSPGGSTWADVNGEVTGDDTVKTFTGPMGSGADQKFYRVETRDKDTDSDGVSDWSEGVLGTDPTQSNSASNASGGVASDADTLHSLLTITATPLVATGFEKENTPAKIRLTRTFGTMPLKIPYSVLPNPDTTKGSAVISDFSVAQATGQTINFPATADASVPYDVVITPVQDATAEVPELVKMSFTLPGVPATVASPVAAVTIKDATAVPTNRRLYVAYLGREDGVNSTATGIATALVEGDNDTAVVSLTFSNLSSAQNNAYIRIGNDLEVFRIPNGQASGLTWPVRAVQFLFSDQASLNALQNGSMYVAISTANYTGGEIKGYFQLSTGSTEFDPANPDLVPPTYVAPVGEALDRDIYRFLSQCTFGATTALYNEVKAAVDAAVSGGGTPLTGYANWLDKQMNLAQTPSIDFSTLVMAADNEEFVMRGNKPITTYNDPQYLDNIGYNVTYDANNKPVINPNSTNTNFENNYPSGANNRRREWWTMVLQAKDQVRQRTAQALSEILVISDVDQTINDRHYGAAEYWDLLAQNAFGKYRPLLEKVTYSPVMGVYLSHIANRQAYNAGTTQNPLMVSPDENYAREIMQLFSIGLVLRHPDGSLVLGPDGLPIPTYDQADITELARVMTGFSHGARHANALATSYNGTTLTTSSQGVSPVLEYNTVNFKTFGRTDQGRFFQAAWMNPMIAVGQFGTTVYHDFGAKTLFANKHKQTLLPAQAPASEAQSHTMAAADISLAHDAIAGTAASSTYDGHQNTPVNLSRWLIQRFTTSNPSAAYIYRVSEVYRSTNGNLGQVVKAILLDNEARSLSVATDSVSFGKVKEPMIHFASILRGLNAFSGAPVANLKDAAMTFATSESPMTTPYPDSEFQKLSAVTPPSLPAGWSSGPFRYRFGDTGGNFGQAPQRAPSVFNWFLPDYVVPGPMANAGLFAPEMQIATETMEVARVNYQWAYTWSNIVGMSTQPGTDNNVSDFVSNSSNAVRTVKMSKSQLLFDSTNWNVPQSVVLTAVNDILLEGNLPFAITHNISSTDAAYNLQSTDMGFTMVDNEVPNAGVTVVQTAGTTQVAEGGVKDTITVRLSSAPTANVTVNLASSTTQMTLSSSTLTFTNATWATPQTVTITAVNDATTEGTQSGNITFGTSSTMTAYNALSVPAVPVAIYDNEGTATIAGLVVTQSNGTTWVTEPPNAGGAGITDTFTVVFDAPLAENMIISVASASTADVTVSPATLTFTTANWGTPQTVTVTGVADTTDEPNEAVNITLKNSVNANLTAASVVANVTDNDSTTATYVYLKDVSTNTSPSIDVTEGGATDTYQVALTKQPSSTLTVAVARATSPSTQVEVSKDGTNFGGSASLSFTTANWATAQTVTVRAVNDSVKDASPMATTITHTVSGGGGNNNVTPLTPQVTDDEGSVIFVESGTDTRVQEGGNTDTYTVVLDRAPAAGTPVTVAVLASSQVTVSPGTLTFTSANWNTAQTVTVTAIDDTVLDGLQTVPISHHYVSSDPKFSTGASAVVGTLNVAVLDNEGGKIQLTPTNGSTDVGEEGDMTDTYSVVLTQAPTANVTISLAPATPTQLAVSPATMTFTTANWNTAQTATVTALDDVVTEGVHSSYITHTAASTDRTYGGSAVQAHSVNIVDDDTPQVLVRHSAESTTVVEAGAVDTCYVSLVSQPASNLTVTLNADAQTRIYTGSNTPGASVTLTFRTDNWSSAQSVNVQAFDDTTVEASPHTSSIGVTVASTAVGYSSLTAVPSIPVQVVDNDSAGIAIVDSSAAATNSTTAATEGAYDNISVVLTKAPTADVILTFTGDAQCTVNTVKDGGTYALTGQRTFTPSTWNVPQNVRVFAISENPAVVEGMHTGYITCAVTSTTDPAYSGKTGRSVALTITDANAKVLIAETNSHSLGVNSTIVQETANNVGTPPGTQGTDTYNVKLASAPTSNVTVAVNAGTQLLVTTAGQTTPASTASLIFTTANWSVDQTVTVRAVNDAVVQGDRTGTITHTASGDSAFAAVSVPSVKVTILENDKGQVALLPSDGNTLVKEGGPTDTYKVVLAAKPTVNVTVTPTTGAQLSQSPAGALTFTAANWFVPQTVTLTAVNDSVAEVTQNLNVTHAMTSSDANFVLPAAATLPVTVVDNDGAQLVFAGSNQITESGTAGTGTYTVALSQAPAPGTTVTVNLVQPLVVTTVPAYTKQFGYYTNDTPGSNQQKDRIVMDYAELITLYLTTYNNSLVAAYAPAAVSATPTDARVQSAHWAASKALVDRLDLWWCGGIMKAKFPTLVEPNVTPPNPLPGFNPRQSIMEGVYNGYSTTRHLASFVYNPASPPSTDFYNEVRDRCRNAAYLVSISPGAITQK